MKNFNKFINESLTDDQKINKRIKKYIKARAKKLKAINLLGGKCEICNDDDIFHLTFHHKIKNDKAFGISFYQHYSWDVLKKEVEKCDLLCKNCHAKHHYDEVKTDDLRRKTKELFVEYAGGKCIICGYDDSFAALTFHHRDKLTKLFSPGAKMLRINDISQTPIEYIEEIEKCDLLCANCHQDIHTNKKIYKQYEDQIVKMANQPIMKTRQPKTDVEKVIKLKEEGKSLREIGIILNRGKSTISGIIKKYYKNN